MRARVAAARVAHLATVRADGTPHIVPVCFALVDDVVLSVVDAKPKRSEHLARLDNVRARPAVSVIVDHYDDDWTQLWWVRMDGRGSVHEDGPERVQALELLAAKYEQYRDQPPAGALLRIVVDRWKWWEAVRPSN